MNSFRKIMEDMKFKTCSFYKPRQMAIHLTFFMAVILGLSLTGCSHQTTLQGEKPPAGVLIDVLYATDRNLTGNQAPDNYYGEDRSTMSYGTCQVRVRPDKAKSPFADHRLWKVDFGEPSSKKIQVKAIREMEKAKFFKKLSSRTTSSVDDSVLIYFHGYGRKFDRAMRTTAGLAYELNYGGAPILYSWPSKGKANAYTADRTTIDWSIPHLEAFLKESLIKTRPGNIHLLAHSLGNRALLRALENLVKKSDSDTRLSFGEIILSAPDVDRDIFIRDYAPILQKIAFRVTLYVSSIDVPLAASGRINRSPRVGNSKKGLVIVEGIQSIDATDVSTLVTGHSSYRDSPEVLSDLYYIINKRLAPENRPTLTTENDPAGRYWKIVPGSALQ